MVIRDYISFSSLRSKIGLEKSSHSLDQSPTFSRAQWQFVCTLSFHKLLVMFSFVLRDRCGYFRLLYKVLKKEFFPTLQDFVCCIWKLNLGVSTAKFSFRLCEL